MGFTMTDTMHASAQAPGVKVSVAAEKQADGSVDCAVTCNGQQANLTFTGSDVLVDVPEA